MVGTNNNSSAFFRSLKSGEQVFVEQEFQSLIFSKKGLDTRHYFRTGDHLSQVEFITLLQEIVAALNGCRLDGRCELVIDHVLDSSGNKVRGLSPHKDQVTYRGMKDRAQRDARKLAKSPMVKFVFRVT